MLEKLRHHPAWPASLIAVFLIVYITYDRRWTYSPIIEWDVCNYYSYIKGVLFEGDPYLRVWNVDSNRMEIFTYKGEKSEKMTGGLAFLYLPGIIVSHIFASISNDFSPDGLSLPYRIGLQYNVLIYLWIGFFVLYKVVFRLVKNHLATFLSLLTVFFGTNLFYYAAVENAMSHAYTFSLFSLWLYLSMKWIDRPSQKLSVAMGLIAGLIIWVRPVNLVLLPAGLGFLFANQGPKKVSMVMRKLPMHSMVVVLMVIIVLIPQMYYWYTTEGRLLVYSYGEEKFFFNDPKIIDGLLSWRKGWLVYSPALVAVIPGFTWLWHRYPGASLVFSTVVLSFLYITFSWWCWWYGGGYSQRSLIDMLPLLAVPMAATWYLLFRFITPIRLGLIFVLLALISLNVFHIWQYKNYLIHFDSNTRKSYWLHFLKTQHVHGWWEALEAPDYEAAMKGHR
ncbi:hypothetical protein [Schleiferia thermophila]|uniref:Glycosyltransferase RgtA/B/C/D-like domain-containing protein n=1 Tax=Schleiferia thermophila TaxID=884107 RepID=A0A369A6I5_9FLAO|nr:hypothetical protein [Schleiferia thermophila]RCX04763.1 hypothetical protein DES35_10133 [Schleiferia thermophila]GCD79708.1 hypothetical protein JCM30197_09550 [Schleiferia thermophila]